MKALVARLSRLERTPRATARERFYFDSLRETLDQAIARWNRSPERYTTMIIPLDNIDESEWERRAIASAAELAQRGAAEIASETAARSANATIAVRDAPSIAKPPT
jgi:hypothetical protein